MEVKEVAERLGVHVNTIYHYINTGQVKAQKKGRSWDISEESFNKLKSRQSQTPRTIIDSLNVVIDSFERARDMYVNLNLVSLQHGVRDQSREKALDRLEEMEKTLNKIAELEIAIDLMLRKRNDMFEMVKNGLYGMDEVLERNLNTDANIEYRTSGDYFVDDES